MIRVESTAGKYHTARKKFLVLNFESSTKASARPATLCKMVAQMA